MAELCVQRRLAAILAADVVGYSRLTHQPVLFHRSHHPALANNQESVLAPADIFFNSIILVLVAVLVVFAVALPVRADTVTLRNGDRITGKFVVFEDDQLRFRTAYAGILSIPRADIASLATDDDVTVLFNNGARVSGRVTADLSGRMRLVGERLDPRQLLDLNGVGSIHPGRDKIPPTFRWSGRINLGFKTESGNTDTDELNISGRIRGRSKSHRLTADAEASIEKANDVTNTEDASGSFTHESFVSEKLFFFTRLFLEYDRFKNLDLRAFLSTGPGYQFYEGKDLNFSVDGGIGWLHEDFKGDAADRDDPAFMWSYEYDQYFFDRFVQAFHNHLGTLNLSHTEEATLKFRWGLRFPMRSGFVATAQFDLDHETEPAPGTKKTDKTLKLSLGYEW